MKRLLAVSLIIAALLASVFVQPAIASQAAPDLQAIDTFVQDEMRKHRIPGLALAVIEGDQVMLAKGYGTAGQGRPMTPDTPMYIGSTTKSFTALAIMQLVEQGKINLDAPVQTYLPWFRVADEHASVTITVRNLLNHASGLSEYGYTERLPASTSLEAGVRDLRTARLTAPVGTTFQYFNPNFATLGLIVEQVSGQSYGSYVQQHIFSPLEMTRSFADPRTAAEAGLAQGYGKFFGFPIPLEQPFRRYALPDGYLISSARDMSQYAIAMNRGGQRGDTRVISSQSLTEMQIPKQRVKDSAYGLGWFAWEHHGKRVVEHGGANEFFSGQLMLLPDQQRGFVMLLNQDHLFDAFVAVQELRMGLLDLLTDHTPQANSIAIPQLGLITLAGFLITVALVGRSWWRMRGWSRWARDFTPAQLIREIAPHFLVPVLVLVGVYQLSSFFMGRPMNLTYGPRLLPDMFLWLFVGTVPDLVQGVYKISVIVAQRLEPRRTIAVLEPS